MKTKLSRKTKIFSGIVLLFVLLVTGISVAAAQGATIYGLLNALRLIPREEHYTELYFNDAASLPRRTMRGETVTFSFTIHNAEGKAVTYPYQVYFEYPAGNQVKYANGSVRLSDDEKTSIRVSRTFLSSNQTGAVVVLLPTLNQSIHFIVPNNN